MLKKKRLSVGLLLLLCVAFWTGCGADDDDNNATGAITDDDEGGDDDIVGDDDDDNDNDDNDDDTVPPAEIPPYLQARPELTDWSTWFETYDYQAPTSPHLIGGLGLGNGRVFALLAAQAPFNTLHNLMGPDYQRHLRFFSDKRFYLFRAGEELAPSAETIYRVRGADILLTRTRYDGLEFWTVDFAPRGEGIDEAGPGNTLIRMIILWNTGEEDLDDLALHVATPIGQVDQGVMREYIPDDILDGVAEGGRWLMAGFVGETARQDKEAARLILPLPALPAGGELVREFLLAFAKPETPDAVFAETAALDPDDLLNAANDDWQTFTAAAARLTTPDRRLDDLLEGMSYTIRTQTTDRGAVSQMSEYTGTWLRDIMGPAVFYPPIGRFEEYLGMLDYYWQGSLTQGGIGNSLELDIELDPNAAQPDWENMGVMGGRLAAESPSYLVLHYKYYLDATGDWAPLAERYGMLRHALIHQNFQEGCLLPFSGDETFRLAMAVGFGQWLYDEYADTDYSFNSSLLFVVAAEFLQQVAEHLGYSEHALEYETLAAEVRACAEQYYWLEEEGYYSPIIDIDTLEPTRRPFEDVNNKVLWMNYLSPDDPQARANMLNMIEEIWVDEGYLSTPADSYYKLLLGLLDFGSGAITGMNYGYTLSSLARLDHPYAETAFLLYDEFFHDSGNVSEGMVVPDFGRFRYLIEPFGIVSDLTARFRTWEGGINAAAILQYLFGLELDARRNRIYLSPHLPSGWEFAALENARLSGSFFDVEVTDDEGIRGLLVDNCTGPLQVDVRLSAPGTITDVWINGEAIAVEAEQEWGLSRVYLDGLTADADSPLLVEATYE